MLLGYPSMRTMPRAVVRLLFGPGLTTLDLPAALPVHTDRLSDVLQ
jgi:hypothetical protein